MRRQSISISEMQARELCPNTGVCCLAQLYMMQRKLAVKVVSAQHRQCRRVRGRRNAGVYVMLLQAVKAVSAVEIYIFQVIW